MITKEELRQKRKEAYQKAKAKRDADPRYQALKEKLKQDQKAKYRAIKDQLKTEKLEAKQKRIAEKDAALMALMIPASEIGIPSMSFTITQLSPNEWQKYRDIRLLALQSDSYAFGSSYEEEIGLSEADWRNRINAMWFAIADGQIAGLIGLLPRENVASKHCGHIVSLWVKEEFRRRGIARSLVQKVQEIAPGLGIKKLSLLVSRTQPAAKQLYEEMGFEEIGLLKENLLKDCTYLDEYLMEWHYSG